MWLLKNNILSPILFYIMKIIFFENFQYQFYVRIKVLYKGLVTHSPHFLCFVRVHTVLKAIRHD